MGIGREILKRRRDSEIVFVRKWRLLGWEFERYQWSDFCKDHDFKRFRENPDGNLGFWLSGWRKNGISCDESSWRGEWCYGRIWDSEGVVWWRHCERIWILKKKFVEERLKKKWKKNIRLWRSSVRSKANHCRQKTNIFSTLFIFVWIFLIFLHIYLLYACF